MSEHTVHFQGRYLKMIEKERWEYVSRSNAHAVAVIVALTGDDELVLVEQYRRPVDARVLELPAGLVGDKDDPEEPVLEAAGRELTEETGFAARQLELIMECPSSAGMSDEIISFIRARGLTRVGPGGGDDSEDIETHLVPLDRIDGWLQQRQAGGTLLDPKIYAGIHWLKTEKEDLT